MKKVAFSALASLGAVVPALAEGGNDAIDTTAASGALNQMTTAVGTYVTAATPYLITLLGSAVVITLIWVGWKLFRKGTNKVG